MARKIWFMTGLALLVACLQIQAAPDGETQMEGQVHPEAQVEPPCSGGHFLSRFGNPFGVHWFAKPSNSNAYVGYYVGGGCPRPLVAEPPRADEGTWGWDYQGLLFRRNVILGWWHGRRYQGGTGRYQTDGPKLLQEKD